MTDTLDAGTGDAVWALNTWLRYVVTAQDTNGQLALLEQRCSPAGDTPPHIHTHEDEAFYVLEGRLRATIGDDSVVADPGECVFLPRGVPHALHAETPEVRGLVLITPAGFERFFVSVGQPAEAAGLPEPAAPDVAAVASAAAKHGVRILPPG
jgi:quercetin dioxygenase-like cupin family protein